MFNADKPPINIFGHIHTPAPRENLSAAQVNLIALRYSGVVGLDGCGFDEPALHIVRAAGFEGWAANYGSAFHIHANHVPESFTEEMFIHDENYERLRVGNRNQYWMKPDAPLWIGYQLDKIEAAIAAGYDTTWYDFGAIDLLKGGDWRSHQAQADCPRFALRAKKMYRTLRHKIDTQLGAPAHKIGINGLFTPRRKETLHHLAGLSDVITIEHWMYNSDGRLSPENNGSAYTCALHASMMGTDVLLISAGESLLAKWESFIHALIVNNQHIHYYHHDSGEMYAEVNFNPMWNLQLGEAEGHAWVDDDQLIKRGYSLGQCVVNPYPFKMPVDLSDFAQALELRGDSLNITTGQRKQILEGYECVVVTDD